MKLMLGLNMPERSDGESTAVLVSARVRLEPCGESRTGDGERKPGDRDWKSENGESGERARSEKGEAADA